MDSKVFRNEYLVNEDDDDILNMQYVIISTRIRKRDTKFENVCSFTNRLYPRDHIFQIGTDEDVEYEYYKQLEEEILTIATLVMGCIDEGFDITFINTYQEEKHFGYLRYLADFIYDRLGYPVYDYTLYANKKCRNMKWDKKSVKKKCKKIIKRGKKERYKNNLKTERGRKENVREFAKRSKKEMKRELDKRNLYYKGMSKSEMIEMYELYM